MSRSQRYHLQQLNCYVIKLSIVHRWLVNRKLLHRLSETCFHSWEMNVEIIHYVSTLVLRVKYIVKIHVIFNIKIPYGWYQSRRCLMSIERRLSKWTSFNCWTYWLFYEHPDIHLILDHTDWYLFRDQYKSEGQMSSCLHVPISIVL